MTDQPLSYWLAVARMGFEDDFSRLFDELGISRTELAQKMGTSPAYVSKILNGEAGNFQLETMTKLARAVGAILQIRLIREEGEVVRVVDYETARAIDEMHSAGHERIGEAQLSDLSTSNVVYHDFKGGRAATTGTAGIGSSSHAKTILAPAEANHG